MASTSFTIGFDDEAKELIRQLGESAKLIAGTANTMQPLVCPPDAGVVEDEPAAVARREIIAKLKTLVDDSVGRAQAIGHNVAYQRGWKACCAYFIECLKEFD